MRTNTPIEPSTKLFWWMDDIHPLMSFDTEAERDAAIASGLVEAWRNSHKADEPVWTSEKMAPDGWFEIAQPWMGGTWGGYCGSSAWVYNPSREAEQKTDRSQARPDLLQSWHRLAIRGWDKVGYRVECERRRHDWAEPCEGAGYRWSWRERATRPVEDLLAVVPVEG